MKHIIIAAIAAIISVTLVLGFASFMTSMIEVWAAEQRPLSASLRLVVATADFVQSYKPFVVLFLIAGSVGVGSVLSILSRRRDITA